MVVIYKCMYIHTHIVSVCVSILDLSLSLTAIGKLVTIFENVIFSIVSKISSTDGSVVRIKINNVGKCLVLGGMDSRLLNV